MLYQEAIESRYSVRSFSSCAPSREQIEAVLQAGRLAPTARNFQPQRIWVATKPSDLAKIDEATGCRYGAPCVFILGYDTAVAAKHDRFGSDDVWSFGDLDVTSVLVHMLLKATDVGLGTCWLGAFNTDVVRAAFGIPDAVELRALVDLGTPDENGGPSPMHADRKPLDQTVTWL